MLRRSSYGGHSMFTCLHFLNRSLLLYSTSVASKDGIKQPLMVEFLVKSVGFSEPEAISIFTKVKVSESISTKKSELVVDFLKETGFDGAQIRKLIACMPCVLRKNVDKTLKPKIRVFEEFGFSGSTLGLIISRHPDILGRNVESSIVPVLEMLKSVMGSIEQMVSCMLHIKPQRFFALQVRMNLPHNVLLLQSYGLSSERIQWLILHSSFLFLSTQRAEKIVKVVEEKLGITRSSDMFMYGIRALTLRSEENMESWLDVFRSFGWSETEISTLLKKHPFALCLSEEHVRLKLKYFMEDLGFGSDYLATHPTQLALSMEKRILPRVAVRQTLMDSNLLNRQISIYTCLIMVESKFLEKFVLPYKEKLPQLYENYIQATGHSLSKT